MRASTNDKQSCLLYGRVILLSMSIVSGCVGGSHEKLEEGESVNASDLTVNQSYVLNPYSIHSVNRIFLNDMTESEILETLQVIMTQEDVALFYQSVLPDVRNCIREGRVDVMCVSGEEVEVFVRTSSELTAACYVVYVSKSKPLRMTAIGFGKIN